MDIGKFGLINARLEEIMEKLTYSKINNSDNVISIDLHNGFTIIAISGFKPEKKIYVVTLYIKDNAIDIWSLVENAANIEINANYKTVNSIILKKVSTYLNSGFFNEYIKRYNFDMYCIDMGYNILQKDRLLKEQNNDNKE